MSDNWMLLSLSALPHILQMVSTFLYACLVVSYHTTFLLTIGLEYLADNHSFSSILVYIIIIASSRTYAF